jgi:hypothetical protein
VIICSTNIGVAYDEYSSENNRTTKSKKKINTSISSYTEPISHTPHITSSSYIEDNINEPNNNKSSTITTEMSLENKHDNTITECTIFGYNIFLGLNPIQTLLGMIAVIVSYFIFEICMLIKKCRKGNNSRKGNYNIVEMDNKDLYENSVDTEVFISVEDDENDYKNNGTNFVLIEDDDYPTNKQD